MEFRPFWLHFYLLWRYLVTMLYVLYIHWERGKIYQIMVHLSKWSFWIRNYTHLYFLYSQYNLLWDLLWHCKKSVCRSSAIQKKCQTTLFGCPIANYRCLKVKTKYSRGVISKPIFCTILRSGSQTMGFKHDVNR